MPRSKTDSYLGNPKLKAVGVNQSFTSEELKEYAKCAKDPIYFIRKYVKIVSIDKGLVPFNLYPFQEEMIKLFLNNRFVITKCPRQCGKSTTTCAYLLHSVIFNDDQNIAILANKLKTSKKLLADLKKAYMTLPMWLQQGVVEWNKESLELENGSKIMASSTSSDAIRGNSFNIIFLDEFAFVPSHVADDFFDSVYPTISSGETSKIFIVSTPKGMNKFYKMWVEADEKRKESTDEAITWNGYKRFGINWKDVPGRNEKWKQDTIARTSTQQAKQEFESVFSDTYISVLNVETKEVSYVQIHDLYECLESSN